VIQAVSEAYKNKRSIGGGKYAGFTAAGLEIHMYLNKDGKTIATAFPIYKGE